MTMHHSSHNRHGAGLSNTDSDLVAGEWPDSILSLGEVVRFDRRELLHTQGEAAEMVHVLLLGKVLREYEGREGARVILDLHARGDLLGVTAYFDHKPHPDTARAHTRGALLAIQHSRFHAYLDREPLARRIFEEQVGRRYRHDTARAASLATDRVETRIRALLCDLSERYGVWGDVRGKLLDLGLTRAELASFAGTTLETVIRTVNKLRERGLLVPDGRRFFIPDPDLLQP